MMGQAPIIIFNDADVPSAVNGTAFASFIASGQTCVSGTRLLVQSGVYDAFVSQFLEKAKSITKRMGDRAFAQLHRLQSDELTRQNSHEPKEHDGIRHFGASSSADA
jgi:acyl-CoA reductase-like NAD-dependent aldehyde dehydrogenase